MELHGGTTTTVGVPTYYLFAGGQRVAALEAGEFTYYSQDHLGGTALATDSAGTVTQLYDYYPYGSELLNSRPTGADVPAEHSFTDKELDADLGLYYFEARWYDSEIGRFSGQDPMSFIFGNNDKKDSLWGESALKIDDGEIKSMTLLSNMNNVFEVGEITKKVLKQLMDPQLLNTYSYARNNPISNIDLFGLESASPDDVLNDIWDATIAWGDYFESLIDIPLDTVGSYVDEMAENNGDISGVDSSTIWEQTSESVQESYEQGLDAWENTAEVIINTWNWFTGGDTQDYDIKEGSLSTRDE